MRRDRHIESEEDFVSGLWILYHAFTTRNNSWNPGDDMINSSSERARHTVYRNFNEYFLRLSEAGRNHLSTASKSRKLPAHFTFDCAAVLSGDAFSKHSDMLQEESQFDQSAARHYTRMHFAGLKQFDSDSLDTPFSRTNCFLRALYLAPVFDFMSNLASLIIILPLYEVEKLSIQVLKKGMSIDFDLGDEDDFFIFLNTFIYEISPKEPNLRSACISSCLDIAIYCLFMLGLLASLLTMSAVAYVALACRAAITLLYPLLSPSNAIAQTKAFYGDKAALALRIYIIAAYVGLSVLLAPALVAITGAALGASAAAALVHTARTAVACLPAISTVNAFFTPFIARALAFWGVKAAPAAVTAVTTAGIVTGAASSTVGFFHKQAAHSIDAAVDTIRNTARLATPTSTYAA